MMSPFSLRSIRDPEVVSQWDALAGRTGAGPFARPGWFAAWAEAFGGDIQLASVGDGEMQAALPLVATRSGHRAPVNQESPEFTAPTHSDDALSTLLDETIGDGGSLELTKVSPELAEKTAVAAEKADRKSSIEVMQRSPYLELPGAWDAYEASLSSNFRQGLRRKRRRLEDEGTVVIEVEDGKTRLEELLDEGFVVESSQWKADRGTAIASDPAARTFYSELARWAASEGWLRLVFMRLDERPIAFRLDLVCEGVYYHVKGGYDPALGRYSPGLLLQHETVHNAFEAGLDRYEFLGADEPYKLNWTSTCRERMAVRVFPPGLKGLGTWAARKYAAPVARKLRR